MLLLVLAATSLHAAEPSLAEARRLFLTGSYSEASEIYSRLVDREPVVGTLGSARCLEAVGKDDKAVELLKEASKKNDAAGEIHAELARLALKKGDYNQAESEAQAATGLLKDTPASAQAKWVLAELCCRAGRLDDAERYYKGLVELYNAQDEIKDADALRYVGLGAAQYARWNRLSDQFHFLVNELYPEIVKFDANYWPAHYEAGLLYLEKFNEPEAAREFKAALAINPNAAEVHAALAALALQSYELTDAHASIKRALEINPRLLWAHQLQADVQLANFEPGDAVITLQQALRLNPLDEQTLGRLAAAYVGIDGLPKDGKLAGTRLGSLIDDVTARNSHAGEFFESLADGLDQLRRYPDAVRFYREAVDRMPRLVGPRGKLGLIYMRLGDEVKADKLLRESFDIDPFNVRVSNTLKVLEVLAGYSALETEHFVIKFDRAHDELLAQYAAKYLEEEVYPKLVKKFGFRPEEKSLFEIFSRAKNTDGHGWFSARMVGLPYIGTVGACAGRMVAMQSPNDARQKFNWARVLRHEFVHVVNLQQTHFNIPHWLTEALAVQNEDFPRPPQWNDLLKERISKANLYSLDTINTGFIRPKSSDDWTLAYCQAELYAEYMLNRFGDDALAKMLAAYADNANTRTAIHRSFGIDQADFEHGYSEYLQKIVAGAGQGGDERDLFHSNAGRDTVKSLKAEARAALEAHDDAKLATRLERLAALDPDDITMRKKLAQISLKGKGYVRATHWAKQCLYIDVQDVEAHRMLADALEGRKEYAEAAKERDIAAKLER
jgi:tetratricopeptide (TPR) repeat protein